MRLRGNEVVDYDDDHLTLISKAGMTPIAHAPFSTAATTS